MLTRISSDVKPMSDQLRSRGEEAEGFYCEPPPPGTGMIASSSTFLPHLGRVIRDLFRLLDAVYGIVRKH